MAHEVPQPTDVPVVKVATAANQALADMWAELLQESGVPCFAKARGVGVGGWWSSATLEHDLYVRASDRERARELLEPYAGDELVLHPDPGHP